MSAYENVVGGKLKLKGKALDVKAGGVKKKKKSKHSYDETPSNVDKLPPDGNSGLLSTGEDMNDVEKSGEDGHGPSFEHHLTAAERRYIEQKQQIDVRRLAKTANKSHRDKIQDFNLYLANLSEHYDTPKVGPG